MTLIIKKHDIVHAIPDTLILILSCQLHFNLYKCLKMKMTLFIAGLFALIPVCNSHPFSPDGKPVSNHKVVVEEVIQTTSYTYLHVKENDTLKWLAVPTMQAKAGETYYYSEGLPMQQFESKELHKTFDVVLFLGGVSPEPFTNKPKTAEPYTRKATVEAKKDIKIDVPKDGISITELFSKKDAFVGKTVIIKGLVTKFSPGIMDKNWIHLQDGTDFNGKFDLTITTNAQVKTGDIITLQGKISLNKDFGYGYFFDVMMEEATIK